MLEDLTQITYICLLAIQSVLDKILMDDAAAAKTAVVDALLLLDSQLLLLLIAAKKKRQLLALLQLHLHYNMILYEDYHCMYI